MPTLAQLVADVEALKTREEIDAVARALRFAQDRQQKGAMHQFSVGDRVEFNTPKHGTVTGTISKMNVKSLSVDRCTNQYGAATAEWKVSATLCRPVGPHSVVPTL